MLPGLHALVAKMDHKNAHQDDASPCRQPELHALTQAACSYVLLLTALRHYWWTSCRKRELLSLITHLNRAAAVVAPERTLLCHLIQRHSVSLGSPHTLVCLSPFWLVVVTAFYGELEWDELQSISLPLHKASQLSAATATFYGLLIGLICSNVV